MADDDLGMASGVGDTGWGTPQRENIDYRDIARLQEAQPWRMDKPLRTRRHHRHHRGKAAGKGGAQKKEASGGKPAAGQAAETKPQDKKETKAETRPAPAKTETARPSGPTPGSRARETADIHSASARQTAPRTTPARKSESRPTPARSTSTRPAATRAPIASFRPGFDAASRLAVGGPAPRTSTPRATTSRPRAAAGPTNSQRTYDLAREAFPNAAQRILGPARGMDIAREGRQLESPRLAALNRGMGDEARSEMDRQAALDRAADIARSARSRPSYRGGGR